MGKLAYRVEKLIANHFGIDEDDVAPDIHLESDLGADENDSLTIMTALKEEFGIEIEEKVFSKVVTVQDLIDIVVFSW